MHIIMTSSNGNISHVTGHLCGEFIGDWWIPRTKTSDAGLWCFFFICAWMNGWVINREAGDLRCHRTLYDVTVMMEFCNSFCCCSGSLEPESSCHDRDWIMELPMEADILTFTGIFTPEDASVASCFPFDITISLSWFPLLSIPPLHSAIP